MQDLKSAGWKDLSEQEPPELKTSIDLADWSALAPHQRSFQKDGVVIFKDLIPQDVMDAYQNEREKLGKDRSKKDNYYDGWHYPTPYMHHPALMDLATHPALLRALQSLTYEPMGLHLCLTGWVSTRRKWHQDSYLNPDYLGSFYAAVWIALEDIHPDSGPFEYIIGSNNWEVLKRSKLFQYLTPKDQQSANWPTTTQDDIARVCEEEFTRKNKKPQQAVLKKGDVLIWHANLIHQGSVPKNEELLRKSLICHYSALTKRFDMNSVKRNPRNGSLYFDIPSDHFLA